METLKDKEKEIKDEQDKQKKKSEHQVAYLSDEMNQLKILKDSNEKKLLGKIRTLEQKLDEREQQMQLLGQGIESLNQELRLREDPSQNAIEVVTYLEKFAKYQNDFMMREIKNFQDDFHKYQNEAYERLRESERVREQNVELTKKLDSHSDELQILKELMKMKEEEMDLFDKERKNYLVALENIRKDGYNMGSLKKENDNLVSGQ